MYNADVTTRMNNANSTNIAELIEKAATNLCTVQQQQQQFLDLAKAGLLSPSEVMTGCYILFGNTSSIKQFTHLLLQKKEQERILAHNFYVVEHLQDKEAFFACHGDRLRTLRFPLFPGSAL